MNYTKHFELRIINHDVYELELSLLAPNKIHRLVADIHYELEYDDYPNQWVLEIIKASFEQFEGPGTERLPLKADTYLPDLINWLKNPHASLCADKILTREVKPESLMELLQRAQEKAIFPIWEKVRKFLEKEENE